MGLRNYLSTPLPNAAAPSLFFSFFFLWLLEFWAPATSDAQDMWVPHRKKFCGREGLPRGDSDGPDV